MLPTECSSPTPATLIDYSRGYPAIGSHGTGNGYQLPHFAGG
jgi:hypothetical protein